MKSYVEKGHNQVRVYVEATPEQLEAFLEMQESRQKLLAEQVRQLIQRVINKQMLLNAENAGKPRETKKVLEEPKDSIGE